MENVKEMQPTALVVGMARSGVGSAKLLYKHGYRVIINDVKHEIPNLLEQLSDIEYENKLGAAPETLLDGVDMLVLSPAIPNFKPFALEAARRGIEVVGEIEIGYRFSSHDALFACISGTNGKTTSTTLTGEMFKASGRKTFVLGNIGIPITEYADSIQSGDAVVAEIAALQLETIKTFHANIAAMINISEDHINRFGSMENYVAAKCRIFENQTESDFAILNYDDAVVREMANLTKAKVVYFSQNEELNIGAFVRGDMMIWKYDGVEHEIVRTNELIIPGRHNVENALCCIATACVGGVAIDVIRKVLRSFVGVEHRIEYVCEKDGIKYYNDSKGTNPDSTIRAVEAMSRPIVLLLGVGEYDKQSDFLPLFRAFCGRVKAVVASGINAPAILAAAERTGFRNIQVDNRGLEEMVNTAKSLASEGDCVLLSPAAASWGMFTDYEERGRVFKDIVREL